jgi:EAL domain-containing protein (putative c-di-GMP-specific phosphodiesterase class I)
LLLPEDFIPDAERTGLIVPLGQWVLNTACAQAAQWQQVPGPRGDPLFIAVNVSPRQLEDPDLPGAVATALVRSGLAADRLSLEITETALLDETDGGSQALEMLSATGARLVLDDFGTGYSSLTHLTRYPIEAVKVDSSFVAWTRHQRPGDRRRVRRDSARGRARSQGDRRGVETEEQLALLTPTGCYGVQGHLFDRPAAGTIARSGRQSVKAAAALLLVTLALVVPADARWRLRRRTFSQPPKRNSRRPPLGPRSSGGEFSGTPLRAARYGRGTSATHRRAGPSLPWVRCTATSNSRCVPCGICVITARSEASTCGWSR